MKKENTLDLLNRIIEKGGLMGACAKMYTNNLALAEIFIKECKAQCHNKFTNEYWGEELVMDILKHNSSILQNTNAQE